MSWKYPYRIVRYAKNAEGKWMPDEKEGVCNTDFSGSRTNSQGGAVSTADALIVTPIAFGETLKKGERLVVYNGNQVDTFDIVKPTRERNRLYAVYAKLNLTYRINDESGEMK